MGVLQGCGRERQLGCSVAVNVNGLDQWKGRLPCRARTVSSSLRWLLTLTSALVLPGSCARPALLSPNKSLAQTAALRSWVAGLGRFSISVEGGDAQCILYFPLASSLELRPFLTNIVVVQQEPMIRRLKFAGKLVAINIHVTLFT